MYNRNLQNDIFKVQHRKTLHNVKWEDSGILKYPRPHQGSREVCESASCTRRGRLRAGRDSQSQPDVSGGGWSGREVAERTRGHLRDHVGPLVPSPYGAASILKGAQHTLEDGHRGRGAQVDLRMTNEAADARVSKR